MKYCSTRGGVNNATFEDVLFSGYAKDGGLFMPQLIPQPVWQQWSHFDYPTILEHILPLFIDQCEMTVAQISATIKRTYTNERFDCAEIAKCVKLNDKVFITELFHGPTWSFKDYALVLVGALLEHFLEKSDKRINILVSTSGDTGSAAISAVKNMKRMKIFVLLPGGGRISKIQELQMTTQIAPNVFSFLGDATSDELDDVIKPIMNDNEFVDNYNITSINSINWGRIMVQLGHWFYCYFCAVRMAGLEVGDVVTIAVPTGACGNVTSGYLACKMGLPIKIVTCSNRNDTVFHAISTGLFRVSEVTISLATAMDIEKPYNMERLIFLGCGAEDKPEDVVNDFMETYHQTLAAVIPEKIHKNIQQIISSYKATDDMILHTVKYCNDQMNYLICPHSATAINFALQEKSSDPVVCIATAASYKFPHVPKSLGIDVEEEAKVTKLFHLPVKCQDLTRTENWMHEWQQIVREAIRISQT